MTAWLAQAGDAVEVSAEADAEYIWRVGRRLRVLRTFLGITQERLADPAGLTRNYLSAVERGRQGVDAVRARRLAAVLGVRIGDLLADVAPAGER